MLALAWSPDGKQVASCGADGTVQVWNPIKGYPFATTYSGYAAEVNAVAWSPDGKQIASGGSDGDVQIWDAATGSNFPLFTYRGHTGKVNAVARKKHLATQLIPTKKRRFSRRTLLKLGGLAGLAAGSSWLTQQVIFTAKGEVPRPDYSPNLGGTLYSYDASSQVLGVAWSPNGRRIVLAASGADWGHVQSWDANTGQHVVIYRDPDLQQQIETVTWLPNGKSIMAAGDDSIVFVWDAATGDRQGLYRGHSGMVITVASSPDSQYIASGGADHTVQVWEIATGRRITIYGEHLDSIGSVAWSPDGRYIASASFDRTVRIWEAITGNTIYTYSRHTDKVYAVAWSPDGKHIASGGLDKTVQVWPVALFEKTGQGQKHSIIIYRGHSRAIQDIAWSPGPVSRILGPVSRILGPVSRILGPVSRILGPVSRILGPVSRILDNRTIASAAENVQLWNGLTGAKIFTYTKHAVNVGLEVQTVAWSPNGKYIASGGIEGTVQVWNATSNNFPAHGNG